MKQRLLKMIGFYQRRISPLFHPRCRFYPACAQYAKEAIQIHGVCKGLILAICRLMRCNILFPGAKRLRSRLDSQVLLWYNEANSPAGEKSMEEKHFRVSSVAGEYATLTDLASGEELFIALALLPLGVDIGTVLSYENLEFTVEG